MRLLFLRSEVGPVGQGVVKWLRSLLDGAASLLGWITAALVGAYAHAQERSKCHHPHTQSLVSNLCSSRSAVVHLSFVFGFHPLPAFTQSLTKSQAAPPSRVLSQMQLPSPAPPLLRDCSFDPFCPSVEGLTEQWPNAGHTQECSRDRAASDAQRLRPGASPPQKKFER